MKLECLKKDITDAVDIASKIISTSATLPVLRCVVFEAKDGEVIARATNLELSVEKRFSAEVKQNGVVALPATILLSALKITSQHTKVFFEVIEGNVLITIGNAKTTIKAIPHDDFPTIPKPENETKYSIPKKTLTTGIKNVLYSASTSLIKPELASVYIYQEAGYIVFVATDSFRLAEKKIPLKTEDDIPTTIIPARNANELLKIIEGIEKDILTIQIDENQYSITGDGIYITSRIIDGSFPDYKTILPKEVKTEIILLKEDFLNTLKKAHVFSDKFGQVSFYIYPSKKTFTISARNTDIGEIFDSLDSVLKGEDLDISFNHRYIIDVFQSITTDSVSLTFAGIGRPLIITGVGDTTFTYLVMPMNR